MDTCWEAERQAGCGDITRLSPATVGASSIQAGTFPRGTQADTAIIQTIRLIQVGTVSRAGIDVIFAAGNCGAPCADGRCQGQTTDAIMGASAMHDVLTIAGCDTHDHRVGYSSQGPSIPNMYQHKPDITSYTHFLGSEAFGVGTPDSGTSAACPVTSGCVAALRTSPKIPATALPPAALFDILRKTARQQSGPPHSWNGDYGFGIINPMAAATTMHL
jgi:hypothetical protein